MILITSSGSGSLGSTPSSPSGVDGSLPYRISSRAASFFASIFVESNFKVAVGFNFLPSIRVSISTGVVDTSHDNVPGSTLSLTDE